MSDTNENQITNEQQNIQNNINPVQNNMVNPVQPTVPVAPQPVQPTVQVPQQTVPVAPQPVQPTVQVPQQTVPVAPQPVQPTVQVPQQTVPVAPQPVQPTVQVPQQTVPVAPQPVVETPQTPTQEIVQQIPLSNQISSKENILLKTSGESNEQTTTAVDNSMLVTSTTQETYEPGTYSSTVNKKKIGEEDDENENFKEELGTYKFPIGIIVGFFVFVLAFLIYYLVIMTPTRAFDGTINDIFDGVFVFLKDIKSEDAKNTTLTMDFEADIMTSGKDIDIYNGKSIKIGVDADLDKGNYGIEIGTFNANKTTDISTGIYIKDNKKYLAPTRASNQDIIPIALELPGDSTTADIFKYEKIEPLEKLVKTTVKEILEHVDDKYLKRSIKIKKINGQSSVALKSNCEIGEEVIRDIYMTIFQEYVDDESEEAKAALDAMTEVFGVSREKVKEKIREFLARDVLTKYINVDLYTNLIDTEVISIQVIVNKYFVNIDLLNGEYDVTFSIYDEIINKDNYMDKNPKFNINIKYNPHKQILSGDGTYKEPLKTNLRADYEYNRKANLEGKNGFTSKLDIYFYEGSTKKPFSEFKNKVDISTGEEIKLFDESMTPQEYAKAVMEKEGLTLEQFDQRLKMGVDLAYGTLKDYTVTIIRQVAFNQVPMELVKKQTEDSNMIPSSEDIIKLIYGQ